MIDATKRYLDIRSHLGYQDEDINRDLTAFALHCNRRGSQYLQVQDAVDWVKIRPSLRRQSAILSAIRRLSLYLNAEEPKHEIIPDFVCKLRTRPVRITPFIYTESEVIEIIKTLGILPLRHPYDAQTYKHIIGLIAATGIRISEALAILTSEVSQTKILINEGKFKKSRFVHIDSTTYRALCLYLEGRSDKLRKDRLFVIHNNRTPSMSSVQFVFRSCIDYLDLQPRHGSGLPRIHDFRHTFAVRALETCGSDPKAIANHIAVLSTHMGHVSLASTYWYLRLSESIKFSMASSIAEVLYAKP